MFTYMSQIKDTSRKADSCISCNTNNGMLKRPNSSFTLGWTNCDLHNGILYSKENEWDTATSKNRLLSPTQC